MAECSGHLHNAGHEAELFTYIWGFPECPQETSEGGIIIMMASFCREGH